MLYPNLLSLAAIGAALSFSASDVGLAPYGKRAVKQERNDLKNKERANGFKTRRRKLALWSKRCQEINREKEEDRGREWGRLISPFNL